MLKSFLRILFLSSSLGSSSMAQDGGQLYALYCSACHGEDGKGASGGMFPPLAGSNWLLGNPKRSIAIVLKGLEGPLEVSGKPYNLAMPPQGAVLEDNQIAAILNYVNSSWGNSNPKIARDTVSVTRSEFESREEIWTAPELLKIFPLPVQKTALKNVISRTYKGQWDRIPDFDKIEAANVEEEHSGLIDISISGMKDFFGIVWEADFIAPEDGNYDFYLQADDGARIVLNDTPIAQIDGLCPMNAGRSKSSSTNLKRGKNAIRIEYFENKGRQGIEIRWKKSKTKEWNWLTKKSTPAHTNPVTMLAPEDDKTVIYRNFIQGTTPRAIGFGFPGELNLAYSADHLAPELLWSGKFIDTGRHWTNRSLAKQTPSGDKVIQLSKKRFLPQEAQFKGYQLDTNGNPSFIIQLGDQRLTDSWKLGETGTLTRTLTLSGGTKTLEIPHGNPEIKASPTINLTPNQPQTLTYHLR